MAISPVVSRRPAHFVPARPHGHSPDLSGCPSLSFPPMHGSPPIYVGVIAARLSFPRKRRIHFRRVPATEHARWMEGRTQLRPVGTSSRAWPWLRVSSIEQVLPIASARLSFPRKRESRGLRRSPTRIAPDEIRGLHIFVFLFFIFFLTTPEGIRVNLRRVIIFPTRT
jgi:hypothetical protein